MTCKMADERIFAFDEEIMWEMDEGKIGNQADLTESLKREQVRRDQSP